MDPSLCCVCVLCLTQAKLPMTEISTSAARNAAFYIVQIVAWLGMALLWYEGDATKEMVLPYFGILLSVLFLSASFWVTESGTFRPLALRTIGTFFLIVWIEEALCLLPPTKTVTFPFEFTSDRRRASYTGGVILLISVFLSFALAYTNFSAPTNAGSRIASVRGLFYLLAVCCCLVASAISWSYDPACTNGGNGARAANAVMVLLAVVILSALLYGCGEADSVALALQCWVLYLWTPTAADLENVTVKVDKHRTQVALLFIGAWLFVLGVILDRIMHESTPLAARIALAVKSRISKLDLLALALGIAGAICTYAFNTTGRADYRLTYAVIIPLFSLIGTFLGIAATKVAMTFLGFFFLITFDEGSTLTHTGYVRGGHQMSQAAVLLVVLSNAIRGRDLNQIAAYPSIVAIAQFVVGASYVPVNYSRFLLIALTVIAGEVYDDADYGRVAYILIVWNGFVRDFLLTITGTPTVLQIINFASAAVYIVNYLKGGAKQACGISFGHYLNAPTEAVAEAVKEAA